MPKCLPSACGGSILSPVSLSHALVLAFFSVPSFSAVLTSSSEYRGLVGTMGSGMQGGHLIAYGVAFLDASAATLFPVTSSPVWCLGQWATAADCS